MKYFLMLLTYLLLNGCDTSTSKTNSKEPKPTIKLESFINNFLDSNKNWNQNDVIRNKTNEKFKAEVAKALQHGLLGDFPLELGEINEYSKGKYAATFESHYIKKTIDYNSILYGVKFDVIGLIDSKFVDTLKEGKAYFITGKFKKIFKG